MGIAADGGAHEAIGGIQTAAGLIGVEVAGDHDDGGLGVPVGGIQGGGGPLVVAAGGGDDDPPPWPARGPSWSWTIASTWPTGSPTSSGRC